MNELDPLIDTWYHNRESGERFSVVATDEATRTVEIQFFEGEVEELDRDTWAALPLELIDTPEDWAAPFDDVEPDQVGDGDKPAGPPPEGGTDRLP